MAGRKPKPTNLKILQGNPGKRKIPENEPKPAKTMPKCPPHLDKIAKKEWRRFSTVLERLGLITEIDGSAFAAYCDQYSRWVQINKDLRTNTDQLRTQREALSIAIELEIDPEKKAEIIKQLSRLPASAILVHDYSIDENGIEHLKISQNPLVVMARQTLQQIRAFCTEFGMTPSSRGRIHLDKKEEESPEEAFLRVVK
jgi:P27 family predicted phage terminase small subunit